VRQPAPAPRFSRTPSGTPAPPPRPGSDTEAMLTELGYSPKEIAALRDQHIAG
jgi:alpha-methylacyl-CoA racemase